MAFLPYAPGTPGYNQVFGPQPNLAGLSSTPSNNQQSAKPAGNYYNTNAAVLGASTYNPTGAAINTFNPLPGGSTYKAPVAPPPGGGGGGGSGGSPFGGYQDKAAQDLALARQQEAERGASDPYAAVRNDISGAWDNYLNSLGETSGYLDQQRGAQEGIANTQWQQGQTTINDQKAKSLKDIANTTRNAFQAGNNYLGSLGAGDSSAANQYSFAINQEAGKQTGDLNNFVNTSLNKLQTDHDLQVQNIAQWFAGKQEELKNMMAQGQLSKGQDLANLSKGILDQAMTATNALKTNTQNQYNALVTWAANNSTDLSGLQSKIAGIPQAMGQLKTFGSSTNVPVAYGGAPTTTTGKTDIFGNPI